MTKAENKKIGIMGGTFDPPHLGHVMSAKYAASQLGLEKVIFLPTGKISYKDRDETANAAHRYEMTRISISDNSLFDICDIEVKSSEYSYTYLALEKLHLLYPNTHFYFIVGADSLDYMERWKEPQRIFDLCSVAVVGREGFTADENIKKAEELNAEFGADIHFVSMPMIDLSSTEIKCRIKNNKSIKNMVCDGVYDYISKHGLYRQEDSIGE